jgi:quercetin dioxygenase-like cupin family protein
VNNIGVALIAFASGAALSTAGAPTPPVSSKLGPQAITWEQIEAGTGKGLSKPVFRSATATLDELEMHVTHLPAGQAPHPPHTHPEEEVVIIKEGTLDAMQSGKTTRLGPGSIIFQASGQLHGVRNVGQTPATYYVIRWASPGTLKARAAKP